jgi:hypothetical protein
MPARCADRIDHFGAKFIGKLAQLRFVELAQISRILNRIQQRCVRWLTHD